VSAVERYDGPLFRVLRRFLAEKFADPPQTWVVSAEFGLIGGTESIPVYDRLMTATRAVELRPGILNRFTREISSSLPAQVFVSVGPSYLPALDHCWRTLSPSVAVLFAAGSIGGRASQLRQWLYGDAKQSAYENCGPPRVAGSARLLGVTIESTPAEILQIARAGLREGRTAATRFQTWFVPVDGARVAPKWLVSELSGLPVSKFRTADARRVLSSLGVQIKHELVRS
jgi:hypothetical protein